MRKEEEEEEGEGRERTGQGGKQESRAEMLSDGFPLALPQILLGQATFGSNRGALQTEEGRAGSQWGS